MRVTTGTGTGTCRGRRRNAEADAEAASAVHHKQGVSQAQTERHQNSTNYHGTNLPIYDVPPRASGRDERRAFWLSCSVNDLMSNVRMWLWNAAH